MNKQEKVRRKLMGDNGFGPEVFAEDEAGEVHRQMEDTLISIETKGLGKEDVPLIESIGRHIDAGTFRHTARRRGGAWRIVSALADRLNEFEGLAQIHLAGAANAVNLDTALACKMIKVLRRLDTIVKATAHDTPETQGVIEQGLQGSREFLLRVCQDAREDYWANFRDRMLRSYDR